MILLQLVHMMISFRYVVRLGTHHNSTNAPPHWQGIGVNSCDGLQVYLPG